MELEPPQEEVQQTLTPQTFSIQHTKKRHIAVLVVLLLLVTSAFTLFVIDLQTKRIVSENLPSYPDSTTEQSDTQVPIADGRAHTNCLYKGNIIAHGSSPLFYTRRTVEKGQSCATFSQARSCTEGVLSGDESHNIDSCLVLERFSGINLNRKPGDLNPDLLTRSQSAWMRANVDILNYYDGTWNKDLSDWNVFIEAQKTGKKGIVNLMWDFEARNQKVPRPNTQEEQKLFAFLDTVILPKLLPSADILVSGNEPFVNTIESDWAYDAALTGTPLARFYERVTDHVQAHMVAHGVRNQHKLYVGAFTRIYDPAMQTGKGSTAVKELVQFADEKTYVDGVDIHTHVSSLLEIDASLKFITSLTDKPITDTEYTYVHLQKAKLTEKLDVDGGVFAQKYGRDGSLTVDEYMQLVKKKPVSKEEWDDFFRSRPWTIDHFILEAKTIFNKYPVEGSTFGLVQGGISKNELSWYMGFLFSATSVVPKDGKPQPNYQYLNDFISLQH